MEYNEDMELRPQDVMVALKVALIPPGKRTTYAGLATSLGMSSSEVHSAVKRGKAARLMNEQESRLNVDRRALIEFVIHGVKYAFPVERGTMTRGMPTSYAAPPMSSAFAPTSDPPPVWPHAEGKVRGLSFSPLCKNAPKAAKKDKELYELLALMDAVREGRARERQYAEKEIVARLTKRGPR